MTSVPGVGDVTGQNLEADLSEDLMVDGDTYGCVNSFRYLGDTLDKDNTTNITTTARIRNQKIDEVPRAFAISDIPSSPHWEVYASCVRNSMTYGTENRPLLVNVGLKFETAEMQIIRWRCLHKRQTDT